jgi:hypothetical protein
MNSKLVRYDVVEVGESSVRLVDGAGKNPLYQALAAVAL